MIKFSIHEAARRFTTEYHNVFVCDITWLLSKVDKVILHPLPPNHHHQHHHQQQQKIDTQSRCCLRVKTLSYKFEHLHYKDMTGITTVLFYI